MTLGIWKYRFLRALGRLTVRTCAFLTLGNMPPMLSAGAVVEKEGRFLLIRDTARGRLALPGGHLHWNESTAAGVRREVREETGHEVAVGRLIGAYGFDSGLTERGIVRLMYEATIVGGSEKPSAEGEVEWVSLAELEAAGSIEATIIRDYLV